MHSHSNPRTCEYTFARQIQFFREQSASSTQLSRVRSALARHTFRALNKVSFLWNFSPHSRRLFIYRGDLQLSVNICCFPRRRGAGRRKSIHEVRVFFFLARYWLSRGRRNTRRHATEGQDLSSLFAFHGLSFSLVWRIRNILRSARYCPASYSLSFVNDIRSFFLFYYECCFFLF